MALCGFSPTKQLCITLTCKYVMEPTECFRTRDYDEVIPLEINKLYVMMATTLPTSGVLKTAVR